MFKFKLTITFVINIKSVMIDSLIVRLGFRVEVDELLRSATWNVSEIICGRITSQTGTHTDIKILHF